MKHTHTHPHKTHKCGIKIQYRSWVMWGINSFSLHRAVWLQVPVLDVHPSLVQFQLFCHPSKTITETFLMDYQKPIIKCSLMDLWVLNLWHTSSLNKLICQKKKRGFQICHMVPTFNYQEPIQLLAWEYDCVCLFMSVWLWASLHCFCQYPFCFDLQCVSPVWLGANWTALETGLSAEFPPQAKLVITFPVCHHFTAIHHYLWLYRTQWWWQALLTG